MNNTEAIKESTEKLGEAVSNLVPQLFFDVIARLIPGFAIIWSLSRNSYVWRINHCFCDLFAY
jgi:hypothetical protein